MLKPYKDPYGFKKLLAYQKAEQLQYCCNEITHLFPKTKTMYDLADQMDRSARSGKQNIVEGWRRNTTKEYYDFLGFCIGAIAELEEDCGDVWKGVYRDLRGIKGVMGEKGVRGNNPTSLINPLNIETAPTPLVNPLNTETVSTPLVNPLAPAITSVPLANPLNPLIPFPPFDIETLKFYPLDETLPPIVQLKLRCKELNFMLHRIQESLLVKMDQEKTLPIKDKLRLQDNQQKNGNDVERKILEQYGFQKNENGQVVKRKM